MSAKKSLFFFFVLLILLFSCSSENSGPQRKRDLPPKMAPQFSGLAEVTVGPNGEVSLAWLPAQDAETPAIDMVYEICLSKKLGGCIANFIAHYTTGPGVTQYTVTNLDPGVTYYSVVRSRNQWGLLDNNTVEKSFSIPGWFSFWGSQTAKSEKITAIAQGDDGYLFCLELQTPTFNQSDYPLLDNLTAKIPYPGSSGGAKQTMLVKVDLGGNPNWFTFIGQNGAFYHQCKDVVYGSLGYIVLLQANGPISSMDGKAPINSYSGGEDILLAKFSPGGNLLWYTFWGGSQNDLPEQIALSSSGKIFVFGSANNSSGTPMGGHIYQGGYDALWVIFSENGFYENHLYLGGSSDQFGISFFKAQNQIALGIHSVENFTIGGQSPIISHSFLSQAGFALVVFNDNLAYQWHTFFGTNTGDVSLKGLTFNEAGWYFVAETSQNIANFSGKTPLVGRLGGQDILLGKYNTTGHLEWFTYVGSSAREDAIGLFPLGDGILLGGNCELDIPNYLGVLPRYPFGGQSDICLFAYHSTGAFWWYSFSSLAGFDILENSKVTESGNILLAGAYSSATPAMSLDGVLAKGVPNKSSAIPFAGLLLNFNQHGKIR